MPHKWENGAEKKCSLTDIQPVGANMVHHLSRETSQNPHDFRTNRTRQYLGQDLQIPDAPVKAEGESVVLAPDNPPDNPSILITQWHFTSTLIAAVVSGEVAVSPSYKGRVSLDPLTLALTLLDLKLSDSGTYRLTVTPSDGGTLTGETSLQVIERVSNVRLIGPEESLIEGESSANITSEGTGSIISVEWMKDNKPLSPSNSIIFSPDSRSVSISPVQRSDSGEYQCTYRNPVSSETAKLSLIINYGPADVSIEGPDVVDLGVSVSLTCSANSEPSASFSWRFNGTDTSVTTNTFTRDETDFTHSGDYECIAWNSVTNRRDSQTHVLLVKVGGAGGGGGGGLTTGAIVGIVIGVLVGVAAICGLIVYLIKTNKIPKLNKEQKGQASGASQSRQEPDSNYEEITDFQTTRGHGAVRASESTVYVNFNHKENEYENVKR